MDLGVQSVGISSLQTYCKVVVVRSEWDGVLEDSIGISSLLVDRLVCFFPSIPWNVQDAVSPVSEIGDVLNACMPFSEISMCEDDKLLVQRGDVWQLCINLYHGVC